MWVDTTSGIGFRRPRPGLPAHLMRTKYGASLVVVMLAALTTARAAAQSGVVIRSIEIADSGGVTNVTIVASGPLPLPSAAVLNDPPRIFFDLPGVTHQIKGGAAVAQDGGVVRGVRVALRTANPPLTRVVVDLNRPDGHRIDANDRKAGRIRVIVGAEAANRATPAAPQTMNPAPVAPPRAAAPTPTAPVTTAPSPAPISPAPVPAIETPRPTLPATNATPASTPVDAAAAARTPPATPPLSTRSPVLSSETPRPALPDLEVAAYRKQVFAELGRMETLRTLVARIDAGESVAAIELTSAAQEFTNLRRKLEGVQPSPVLAVTHDLLMTSCTFAAMASRLGIEAAQANNPETKGRAASAAAGSLMLFDRACAALGCTRPPR